MKLTQAEWQVMNALWKRHPATAREIARRLPPGINWAYTTIKTMLARLAEKKVISQSKKGNTSVYKPIVSRSRARRTALKALANQAFDGAFGPLMHFLIEDQSLTPKQRREMMKALSDYSGQKGETK
ncbi:MAG: BlaI/MecI/CopY family transcriptional regulator [Phycisphaerae bacterium]|nr:BlaI/MecI/CopY family transcriptional regulator [Phycisphaerae bacterium]